MNECRAGEIVEAQLVEPAAAPLPGSDDRIDERHEDRGEDHERRELDTFCDRTGNDRCGGRGEHRLEEEVSPVRVTTVRIGDGVAALR